MADKDYCKGLEAEVKRLKHYPGMLHRAETDLRLETKKRCKAEDEVKQLKKQVQVGGAVERKKDSEIAMMKEELEYDALCMAETDPLKGEIERLKEENRQLEYRKGSSITGQQADKLKEEVYQRDCFLEREGYRRCDAPACNCGRWHRVQGGER